MCRRQLLPLLALTFTLGARKRAAIRIAIAVTVGITSNGGGTWASSIRPSDVDARDAGVESARSVTSANSSGMWIRLPALTGRRDHTAIRDPVRDRMLVFGGYDGSYSSEVWALTFSGSPAWARVQTTGGPPAARAGHAAIYDPVRDRMVILGGYSGTQGFQDVWELSLSGTPAWIPIQPSGNGPTSHLDRAVYDPVRDRMLVLSGPGVWALALSGAPAWTQVAGGGSPSTSEDPMLYDPVRDRLLVIAGSNGGPTEAWALPLTGTPAWSPVATAGTPPSIRVGQTATYDPAGDRVIGFGGEGGSVFNDVWELSLSATPTWSSVSAAGSPPAPRRDHSAMLDPSRNRLVVFGGSGLNDTWELSLPGTPAWNDMDPAGAAPPVTDAPSAVYDSARDRMILFGGLAGDWVNDVWELSLSEAPAWGSIVPLGVAPEVRYSHTAIYDPVGDRMIVFGGGTPAGVFNDVWELALSGIPAWHLLSPSGTPPVARSAHTAIYDPVRARMIVFAGSDGAALDDLWELSLSGTPTWTRIVAGGGPPAARYLHSAIYDPVRDRMILFSGLGATNLDDVWELTLSGAPAWNPITIVGPPLSRYGHSAIYDPLRDRMVVFGGYNSEAWELPLGASPSWSMLAPLGGPPSNRFSPTAIYDGSGDRMIVFGGGGNDDPWALTWGSPVSVQPRATGPSPAFVVSVARPNPASQGVVFDVDLSRESSITVEAFDVTGRSVRTFSTASLAAGHHSIAWDRRDRDGHIVPAGVYLFRFRSSIGVLNRNVVVL